MAEPLSTADRYLGDVAVRLPGSSQTRRRLSAEIRDHLDDAIAANLDAGLPVEDAEQQAVEQLGPPAALAAAWEARCFIWNETAGFPDA